MASHPLKDFIIPYKAGAIVYQEGDVGAEMFIVHSGSVNIFRHLGGQKQVLAVMERGDFFGEMSVLEGSPRSASAEAVEDSELIEINSTVFDRMIRGNIEIAVRMLRKLSGRLQESNRKLEELLVGAAESPVIPVDMDRAPEPEPMPEAPPPPRPVDAGETADQVLTLAPEWRGALVLDDGNQVFPIQADHSLIGRFDPVTGVRPEIDLTPFDTNRSVSRRHAKVMVEGGDLLVTEEVGALNGTFLNGRRLTPGKPEPLRSGDSLKVGMLTLQFHGKESTE